MRALSLDHKHVVFWGDLLKWLMLLFWVSYRVHTWDTQTKQQTAHPLHQEPKLIQALKAGSGECKSFSSLFLYLKDPSGAVQSCCPSAWTALTDNSWQSSYQAIGQLGQGCHGCRHTLALFASHLQQCPPTHGMERDMEGMMGRWKERCKDETKTQNKPADDSRIRFDSCTQNKYRHRNAFEAGLQRL